MSENHGGQSCRCHGYRQLAAPVGPNGRLRPCCMHWLVCLTQLCNFISKICRPVIESGHLWVYSKFLSLFHFNSAALVKFQPSTIILTNRMIADQSTGLSFVERSEDKPKSYKCTPVLWKDLEQPRLTYLYITVKNQKFGHPYSKVLHIFFFSNCNCIDFLQ